MILVATVAAAVGTRPRPPRASDLGGATVARASSPLASSAVAARDLPEADVPSGLPVMLHGDAHRSHRAHGHVPLRPRVAWSYRADGPIEGQVVAAPDGATLYVATLGGSLVALDRSGAAVFSVPLGARAYGTPSVGADGTVYVGTDGGALFAVGPDGRVRWKLETSGDADSAALLAGDGLVVLAAGSQVLGVRGGVLIFRFAARGKVFTAPALARSASGDPLFVVGSQDHHVYALTVRGYVAWSVDLGRDVDGAAAVGDDGGIFVGTDGDEVTRLAADGKVVWRAPVGGPVRGPLAVGRDGDVLAGVYGPSPRVVRISPDGATVTTVATVAGNGTRETGVLGGPLEDDDGALAFGAQDGMVRAVDARGRMLWVFDARSEVDAPLTLVGDAELVVATYAGDVMLLREDL